jgi:hypothetical protein
MIRPAILDRLKGVQRAGKGWLCYCPAHRDQNKRSLSVGVGEDGRTLLNCHAQACPAEKITSAVGMTVADLAPPSGNGHRAPSREIVSTYDYTSESGELLYQVVRLDPKDFRCRRPDGKGGWTWSLGDVRVVPYRVELLAEAARVWIAEGERDVDSLVTLGLVATCNHGGAGKWRDVHTQALVAAAVPEVVVLRDNDQAGEAHQRSVATACVAAGIATVKVIDLPDLPAKGDVSDYIAQQRAAGKTDDEIRAGLLALADQAPVFTPSTASTEPDLRREGFDLVLSYPDAVRFTLTAIRDGRDGVRGEMTVTHGARRLSWGSLPLSSTTSREGLRKKLEAAAPELPWSEYLEDAAFRLTQAARQGEPIVTLTGKVTSPTRELLPRLLYEGEPTQVHADGDTGKSLSALAIAIAMQSGTSLPFGLRPARAVLSAYLDWETGRDTIESRLSLIAAGLGIDPPAILYKRMTRPLVDEAPALAVEFARRGVGFVVIDSKMFAVSSGDGAAFHEPITAFYNALRLFAPAASLVLNHITNDSAKAGTPARPFGGAFAFNGPRLIWEAKRDHDVDDATAIVFTCRKANNLPRKPEPFGLRFVPGDGTITVYPLDLQDAAPSTVAGASLPYRLRLALASGALTVAELAEHLAADEGTVGRTVRRLRDKGQVVQVGEEKPYRWGLVAR